MTIEQKILAPIFFVLLISLAVFKGKEITKKMNTEEKIGLFLLLLLSLWGLSAYL